MEQHKTLADQLADYKAGFKQRVAPERVAMMEAATADLRASGIEARAVQVGARAPDVTLPDTMNRPVRLSDLWRRGPLVLVFYRGGWCPYCNLELRAWSEHLPSLRHMGSQLVAVSPQTPDNSLSTAQKNELAYPVLSDSELQASEAFGVAFEFTPEWAMTCRCSTAMAAGCCPFRRPTSLTAMAAWPSLILRWTIGSGLSPSSCLML